jgi:hypothetical protein
MGFFGGTGENIGWIHFQSDMPVVYQVKVCIVDLEDLANFVSDWLASDVINIAADLDHNNLVDIKDFAVLASFWLDYCPDAWPL